MKIYIECKSLLLQKSLEIFLEQFLVLEDECEFIVSDFKRDFSKPVFYVDGELVHLKKPFSKECLILELEKFYEKNFKTKDDLDAKIAFLTTEFSEKLQQVIREHYEK